ncbi:PIN domain-containing protein [Rubrobacter aplysinae]|uniref:PIN domain-containing protein n=1 Tax=Rubrobacter aplysinae TaxID=909625 RepID=UPI00069D8BD2|nr:PIN domain-containing protein [Rubrobacter aplysinae]
MTGFKVVLDANVLYPVYLRDLLLHFAERGFYEVRWTDQILQEVARSIKRKRPEAVHHKVDRMVARLNVAFEEARITGHEDLIEVMQNHPKDRHVLAAAVKDNADMIVTNNVIDFPRGACDKYDVEIVTPDEFLLCQWALCNNDTFCTLLQELVDSYSKPSFTLPGVAAEAWAKTVPNFSEAVLTYVLR